MKQPQGARVRGTHFCKRCLQHKSWSMAQRAYHKCTHGKTCAPHKRCSECAAARKRYNAPQAVLEPLPTTGLFPGSSTTGSLENPHKTSVDFRWANQRRRPKPEDDMLERMVLLEERLDATWFDSKWRKLLDDGCRSAAKSRRKMRGLRLYVYLCNTRPRGNL